MQKVARTLRAHRELLLNWFQVKGLDRGGGGLQQQGESHHEKSLRLPDLRGLTSRALSHTGRLTRARGYRQILLRRQTWKPSLCVMKP
jgi:hypothetical protein